MFKSDPHIILDTHTAYDTKTLWHTHLLSWLIYHCDAILSSILHIHSVHHEYFISLLDTWPTAIHVKQTGIL